MLITDTGNLHISSGLLGDRAFSVYKKGLLRRLSFKGHTGKPLHVCWCLPEDGDHWFNMIMLFRTWSCKEQTGNPLHAHSHLLGDRAHQVNTVGICRRWSYKGYTGKPLPFVQGFQGKELI